MYPAWVNQASASAGVIAWIATRMASKTCLLGAGAQPAQDRFDLGKRLLDRREVGRVGRQEEELAVPRFNRLANTGGLVDAQIIEYHHLSRAQRRANCSVMYQTKVSVFMAPRVVQGSCSPSGVSAATSVVFNTRVAWHRSGGSLVMRCPAIEPGQSDGGATFVDKDELLWVQVGRGLTPGFAGFLVPLASCQGLFLCVQPRRRMARYMVASLSCWLYCSAHQAQCSCRVASGPRPAAPRALPPGPGGSHAAGPYWVCAPGSRSRAVGPRPV